MANTSHLRLATSNTPTAPRPTLSVLAVDDDRAMLLRLEMQLKQLGYDVVTAPDGETALTLLEQEPLRYGALLLDREMPGTPGLEVVRRLKQNRELSRLPVIMQTGSGQPQQIKEGIDAGVFYYLTKPYEQQVLASVTAAAIREAEQQRNLKIDLRRHRSAFALIETALFQFASLGEAQNLAAFAANCFPDPERVVGGLAELLVNAVEHGNLGIGYEEKTRLVEEGRWVEEIEARRLDPEHACKRAELLVRRKADGIYVQISDQGAGFDAKRYLTIDPARATHNHGRGIAQAAMLSFDKLNYLDPGNKVVAMVSSDHAEAEGFAW